MAVMLREDFVFLIWRQNICLVFPSNLLEQVEQVTATCDTSPNLSPLVDTRACNE